MHYLELLKYKEMYVIYLFTCQFLCCNQVTNLCLLIKPDFHMMLPNSYLLGHILISMMQTLTLG